MIEGKSEELRDLIVSTCRMMADYWANQPETTPSGRKLSIEDRCNGVAFSILAELDGCGSLPPMILEAETPPDDGEEYDDEFAGVRVSDRLHEYYYGGKE